MQRSRRLLGIIEIVGLQCSDVLRVDALNREADAVGGVCSHERLGEGGVRGDDAEGVERNLNGLVGAAEVEK